MKKNNNDHLTKISEEKNLVFKPIFKPMCLIDEAMEILFFILLISEGVIDDNFEYQLL